MKQKLITHISPTESIFADDLNYILVLKDNPKQLMKNGHSQYFRTLEECFAELLEHRLRAGLADDTNKTIGEIVGIIRHARKEIIELFGPFRELPPSV